MVSWPPTEPLDALAQARDHALEATDSELLGLCELLVLDLFGADCQRAHASATLPAEKVEQLSNWPRATCFNDRELAYFAFAEQFATSVASVSDADVSALLRWDSDEQVFAFVSALYVIEMDHRLALMLDAVSGDRGAAE